MLASRGLAQGSSGAELQHHHHEDGKTVIKINTSQPHRIHREIAGTQMLLAHPAYRRRILPPVRVDLATPRITYPYVEGIDLRTALVERHLQDGDVIAIAQEVSRVEKERAYAGLQRLPNPHDFVSMQRLEWDNTLRRIAQLMQSGLLAGVNPNAPLVIGGKQYPSLNETIGAVNSLLVSMPPYVDLGHNDLTQSNILLTGADPDSLVFIDHEWAGCADPAESLVRTAKARKTYDLPDAQKQGFVVHQGMIIANQPVVHDAHSVLYETTVAEAIPSLSDAYRDVDFGGRFRTYMAGSYLREVAMSEERSGPHRALCAIMEASIAVAEAA